MYIRRACPTCLSRTGNTQDIWDFRSEHDPSPSNDQGRLIVQGVAQVAGTAYAKMWAIAIDFVVLLQLKYNFPSLLNVCAGINCLSWLESSLWSDEVTASIFAAGLKM